MKTHPDHPGPVCADVCRAEYELLLSDGVKLTWDEYTGGGRTILHAKVLREVLRTEEGRRLTETGRWAGPGTHQR